MIQKDSIRFWLKIHLKIEHFNEEFAMFSTLISILLLAQTAKTPVKPDLSTPERTLKLFAQSLERRDWLTLYATVYGLKYDPKVIEKRMKADTSSSSGGVVSLSIRVEKVSLSNKGKSASVTAKVKLGREPEHTETVPMRRTGSDWKIVPFDMTTPEYTKIKDTRKVLIRETASLPGLVNEIDKAGLDSSDENHSPKNQESSICRNNVSSIGMALIMYLQDHEEKITFTPDKFLESIKENLDGDKFNLCPLDKRGKLSYSYNTNINEFAGIGKDARKQVVLVYEGHDGKLDFRHGGGAWVYYLDGHIEMINSARAAKLKWKP